MNHFIRYSFLNNDLYLSIFLYNLFNNFLNVNYLGFFNILNYRFFNYYLFYYLHFLNYYLGNWNLNDLQNRLFNYHYFLNNSWNFNNLLNNSWNYNDLLNNLLDFNHSRNLNYLLNNLFNVLNFNSHNLFFNYHWNWFLHYDLFNYLLLDWYQFYFFNFQLFDLLIEASNRNINIHRNLFSNIKGNNFLYFNISCDHNLFDYWLIDKNFNFFVNLDLIRFNKMRSFDINLFRHLPNNFFLLNHRHLFDCFILLCNDNGLVAIFNQINILYIRIVDFYCYLSFNRYYLFLLNYVRNWFLNLLILNILY